MKSTVNHIRVKNDNWLVSGVETMKAKLSLVKSRSICQKVELLKADYLKFDSDINGLKILNIISTNLKGKNDKNPASCIH